MQRTIFPILALLALLAMDGRKEVQAQQEPVYPWCLRDSTAQTHTCAFSSPEQCRASRNSTADDCIPNPAYRWR